MFHFSRAIVSSLIHFFCLHSTAGKVRSKWTGNEVKAVERHMIHFITSCTVPGKRTVTPASRQNQWLWKTETGLQSNTTFTTESYQWKGRWIDRTRTCQLWLRCNLISVELIKLLTVCCYNQCHLRYPVKMFVMGFVLIFSFSFKDCYWWFLVQACHLVLTEAAMLTCIHEGYWLFFCFFYLSQLVSCLASRLF